MAACTIRSLCLSLLSAVAFARLWSADAAAKAPRLYSRAAYQSPVHGDPDDLLFLAGDSLSADVIAVYQTYTSMIPEHPVKVPSDSSPLSGVAPIVSSSGSPYQVIVHLPANLLKGHPYRIWVKTSLDEWSNGVSINDARPLWFSPSVAYATGQLAHLPRYVKVIGRNLLSTSSRPPAIRLVGRTSYELRAAPDEENSPLRQTYVVERRLPNSLEPGPYRVELQTAEARWIAVPNQTFTVRADPPHANEFTVSDPAYGRCRPNDGQDDTVCAAKAIEAARHSGGGVVIFTPGTWTLTPGALVVPPYVDIRGQGAAATRVVRVKPSRTPAGTAEFVLLGHNSVSGISFSDEESSNVHSVARPILQIGRQYSSDAQPRAEPSVVSDVVITGNVFDKTDGAVVDGGNPMEQLYVTYNQFGDYRLGLNLGGNRYNVRSRFGVTDAVIAHNEFMAGSYLDLELRQGAIASEVGASRRMDFSSNVADGSSRRFLYSSDDAPGWRAGFFWHMNDSHEMLLISDNNISCSGDKDGDGEAISLDSNANTFGLPKSEPVLRATQDSVSFTAPLKTSHNDRAVDVDGYYIGHWLRVDAGPGIGQSRRIVAYRRNKESSEITLRVEPPWDVPPEPDASTVSVAREYWQAMIIGNTVDQREPLCLKSNRNRPKGGNISLWGQSADTVIAGNNQFDTDGIVFEQKYGADDAACAECRTLTSMPAFLEIRNNRIEGEYDWASACSLSGITGSYSASPGPHSTPPLLSFGVSISHNRIEHADGLYGGAISLVPTWFSGPQGYVKPLLQGLIIDHNVIQNVAGIGPRPACGYAQDGRYGIYLHGERHVEGIALYRNACEDVTNPLRDNGLHTKRLCDVHDAKSCECRNGN